MKKIKLISKYILTFTFLILFSFIVIGCRDDKKITKETKVKLEETIKNIKDKTKVSLGTSVYYYYEISNTKEDIFEIEKKSNNDNLTEKEALNLLKDLEKYSNKLDNLNKEESRLTIYLPPILKEKITFINILKYPEDYKRYFAYYVVSRFNNIKDYNKESEEAFLKNIDLLINYMDNEIDNKSKPSKDLDFCRDKKNPFLSTKPKFINLPDNSKLITFEKREHINLLKKVKAKDFQGKDISVMAQFLQSFNSLETGINYVQIKVRDEFGNESISDKVYKCLITERNQAPKIAVLKEKELTSFLNAKQTDLRSYCEVSNPFGIYLDKNHIFVRYIFNEDGENIKPSKYKRKTLPKVEKDIITYYDFSNIEDITLLNELKYLSIKDKKVKLPTLNNKVINWQTNSNKVDISNGFITLLENPLTNEEIIIKAENKEFKINLLSLAEEEYISLPKPGTYKIGFQAVDDCGNYSSIVEKELTALPPSQKPVSNLVETHNLNFTRPTIDIKDFDKLDDFIKTELFNIHYKSTTKLAKRSILENNKTNKESKFILFDEAYQFSKDINKLDGYHIMTYDLINYLDGFVPYSLGNNFIIPSSQLIDMFHKNGVKIYGYINISDNLKTGTKEDILKICEKENGKYKYLDLLVKVAKISGFDGYAIGFKSDLIPYEDELKLSQANLKNYLLKKEEARKTVEDIIIPFLKEFSKRLKEENLNSIIELGINNDGVTKNSNIYTNEYKDLVEGFDYIVTQTDNPSSYLNKDREEEIKTYEKDLNKSKYTLYKGIFAGYRKEGFTIDNIKSLLNQENKLETSIAIYSLSNSIFNYRDSNFNYNNSDPNCPKNIYGANNYDKYILKLLEILKENLEYPNEDKEFLKDFSIPNLINKKVLKLDYFETNFNTGNGYYLFNTGEKIKDFRKNKTWNKSGGINNLKTKDHLPIFRKTKDYDLLPNHNIAYNGYSSIDIITNLVNDQEIRINLFDLDLTLDNPKVKLVLKLNNPDKTKLSLLIDDDIYNLNLDTAKTNYQEILLDINNKNIRNISLLIKTDEKLNYEEIVNLGLLKIYNPDKQFNNYNFINPKINKIGFNHNITADTVISFDNINNDNYIYKVYQKDFNNKNIYLTESSSNTILVKDIIRYSKDMSVEFPDINDYQKEIILEIIAYKDGVICGSSILTHNWPGELIKGGKAKLLISSKIAKEGEPIYITPVLSKVTKSYEINFSGDHKKYILPDGRIALIFLKEGYYNLEYITKNPYGEDKINLLGFFIISNDIPSESDLTGDAFIDDREEMKGIKYSNYVNMSERPRYLLDSDKNEKAELNTKWCDNSSSDKFVIIEFNSNVTINRFVLAHSAASLSTGYDKNESLNTLEYQIFSSLDGKNWTKIVQRENNTESFTEDKLLEPVEAKYLKLVIVNGGSDKTARIYDMRIYGNR